MERVTVRVAARDVHDIDELVDDDQYASRSDAVRAALREFLRREYGEFYRQSRGGGQ